MYTTSSKGPQKKERLVSTAKVRRDAELVRAHAAVVIVLNTDGLVTEVITRDPRGDQVVRLIVVLAPAYRRELLIGETVVFEIGFSRARPYQQVERYGEGGQVSLFIKPRHRLRKLTFEEYASIAPVILRAMREILFALRESWLTKEAWEAGPKRVAFERGIFFTVHRSDTHAYAYFLKEDLRFRRSDYLPHHASILRGFISRRIHSAMTLSKAQLARTKWVTVLLEHCETVRLPAIYVQALATYFLPREWDAFTRVCELMGVALPRGDAQTRLIAQPFARELFGISGMFLVAKHDERTRHARNCFVVEAIFEKEYRERHEIPF